MLSVTLLMISCCTYPTFSLYPKITFGISNILFSSKLGCSSSQCQSCISPALRPSLCQTPGCGEPHIQWTKWREQFVSSFLFLTPLLSYWMTVFEMILYFLLLANFFFNCKIRLLMITLYNLLPIFDVTNFRVFEIGRILVGNWHKPQYLSSLNCFCDFFLFLPTKTCYVPSINASSKWRNKLG